MRNPQDALTVGRRAVELGFTSTVGIIHDGDGQLRPLTGTECAVYLETKKLGRGSYGKMNFFQDNIAHGKKNNWRCRAGARYLYICEEGLVHYCSQQRGHPGVPLESYAIDDIRREFATPKSCAPYCTVGCVHRVSTMDFWRSPQTGSGAALQPRARDQVVVRGDEDLGHRGGAPRRHRDAQRGAIDITMPWYHE